jgi:hypothetical protein
VIIIYWSIYPWSIKDFIKRQTVTQEMKIGENNNYIRIFPKDLYDFIQEVKSVCNQNDKILFLSKEGKGENDFFLLSYELYPQKIFWISDLKPGSINNWWLQNDMTPKSIVDYLRENEIHWIISYGISPVNDSSISSLIKISNYILYKKI